MTRYDDRLTQLQCHFSMRPYQKHAIEVAEKELARNRPGGRKWHLVAPPGSGKTVLGLELVRRQGHPAVVFSPNAAIQRQWIDQVRFFLPQDGSLSPGDVVAGQYQPPAPPILSLTYQSLSVATRDTDLLDELAHTLWAEESGDPGRIDALRSANPDAYREELGRFRARVRRQLMEDPEFDPLRLLHHTARSLIEGLIARGTGTVVLDECHHLTGTWAILLSSLVERLDDPIVIGLTATPPVDRSDRERSRYLDLVGEIDFQVPTPAVVREGNLAPYQDLIHFTRPTGQEMQFVAAQHAHWQRLQKALNRGGRFDAWVEQRVRMPRSDDGRSMTWETFSQARRTLAVSAVRWFLAHNLEIPPHVTLTREMIEPLAMEDRLRLIADFALRSLRLSDDPAERALFEQLRTAGRALGYNLTESGFRRTVAPVDRLLSLSRSKLEGAMTILRHEWEAMGEQLRAVVITDFERSSATILRRLSGVLDPEAESALGMMGMLAVSDLEHHLRPVLVTGRTLLCDDTVVDPFMEAAQAWFEARNLDVTIRDEYVDGRGFHHIHGSGADWRTGTYVAMVTSLLEAGITRCLVGTRALLGEGWDSLSLNTFIDLTYATTSTSVNQLRGRAIRLDPAWPEKVANNWDVVCIAPGYEKGLQDYERFVRKHDNFFGISDDGVIEAGVGHVHPLLHDLGGVELEEARDHINAEMLERARDRERARRLWQVGTPYEDVEVTALEMRVPANTHPRNTVPLVGRARQAEALRAAAPLAAVGSAAVATLAITPGLISLAGGLGQTLLEAYLFDGIEIGRVKLGVAASWLLLSATVLGRASLLTFRAIGQRFWHTGQDVTMRAMGTAVLEALQKTEQLPASIPPQAIRITDREDGYTRLWLDVDDSEHVECFARAMAELLGPVTDDFRYMIPRYELVLPDNPLGKLWRWLQWATNRWAGEVAHWHPVPHDLGVRAERVRKFEDCWQRYVSPGEAVFLRRADALEWLRVARRQERWAERWAKRIWR